MGIYGRDYMQDPSPRRPGFGSLSMTTRLILVTVVLWFVYAVACSSSGGNGALCRFISDWLALHPQDVIHRFRIWQPLTAIFLHHPSQLGHVLFNMLFLWVFGRPTEIMIGPRGLLRLYLGCGLASTLAIVFVSIFTGNPTPALGASGAVYGVGVYLAFRQPNMPLYFFFVRMPLWVLVSVFMVGRELVNLAVLGNTAGATIGHLAGAAGGLVAYRLPRWRTQIPTSAPKSAQKSAPKPPSRRPAPPAQEDVKEQVDALLEKIHAEGIGALTPAEKDFLERASQRFQR